MQFLLYLNCYQILGQSGYIHGLLTDSLNGKGVPYAQVYNESSKTNTTSDSIGVFKLKGRLHDTLVILSLGYYGKTWTVENCGQNLIIINPRSYEIEPVIISTPQNYKQFKKAFLEIDPDTGLVIEGFHRYIPKLVPDLMDTNIIGSTAFAYAHPISYIYYNYSKLEKSKRKVLYLKQEQKEQVIIDQKFSLNLVHQLTGLTGEAITDFIIFCNFSHKYLFESSEYEIVEAISQKFEEYKKIP
jgi:hypothetical protein